MKLDSPIPVLIEEQVDGRWRRDDCELRGASRLDSQGRGGPLATGSAAAAVAESAGSCSLSATWPM